MATSKKSNKKEEAPKADSPNKGWQLKSAGWLIELAFRIGAGLLLVTKFDHMLVLAAGFYALGTAVYIIGYHVVMANKK